MDENDAKCSNMASGEGCFARGGDTGDLNATDLLHPASLPLLGGDCGLGFRRSAVKRSTRPRRSSSIARSGASRLDRAGARHKKSSTVSNPLASGRSLNSIKTAFADV
jgi:hypothetical protein